MCILSSVFCTHFNLPSILQGIFQTGGSDGKESARGAGDMGQEDPLEKAMAIHSSILAWKTP